LQPDRKICMLNKAEKPEVLPAKKVKKILIAQAQPEGAKSPYSELANKYNVAVDYYPFIVIEAIAAKEFRKQKIDIAAYTAVIFTSRHAIDHFFRICEEMKVNISQDTKYFCITEAIALYLQKFILYRKRKVFYGADGTNKSLFDVKNKHKENEKFLYPCSQSFDSEITNWLKHNKCEYATPVLYNIVSNDLKKVISKNYDIICFFTPGGVKSFMENFPGYQQNGNTFGAFGQNTCKAAEDAGITLDIKAPVPQSPGMVSALDKYLQSLSTKKK
jgi:uroporphyrinogen-III synthase